jgi:hypothetical protein
MNIFQEYVEYLKDNPKGYWFKRKLYGWGWTPARSEGWLTILVYLAGVILFAVKSEGVVSLEEARRSVIAPIIILTILLIVICYKKGEKPRWQWGKQID